MLKRSLRINLPKLVLVLLATSPAFALGIYGSNGLLNSFMYIAPFLFIFSFRIYRSEFLLILFALSLSFFQLLFNSYSIRWSTILFTYMYVITFLLFKRHINSGKLPINDFLSIIKALIFSYTVVLFIQQFCVFFSIPIFNVSNYHPQEPYKLNSLMSEPSHSARVMAILMLSYLSGREINLERSYNLRRDSGEDKFVWRSFIWTMLTMGSGAAFIFFAILILKFIKLKSILKTLFVFIGIMAFISVLGLPGFDRSFNILQSIFLFDIAAISAADPSGAFRIIPVFILAGKVGITGLSDLVGHGVDYVASFMSDEVRGLPKGATAGGLLQLWMDFGFISFSLFILYNILYVIRNLGGTAILMWAAIVLLQGINNQITWLLISLFIAIRHYKNDLDHVKE